MTTIDDDMTLAEARMRLLHSRIKSRGSIRQAAMSLGVTNATAHKWLRAERERALTPARKSGKVIP
jgi:hypothetical protein